MNITGRAMTPEARAEVLAVVAQFWEVHPGERLGQVLSNAAEEGAGIALRYCEDQMLQETLRDLLDAHRVTAQVIAGAAPDAPAQEGASAALPPSDSTVQTAPAPADAAPADATAAPVAPADATTPPAATIPEPGPAPDVTPGTGGGARRRRGSEA